MQLVLSSKSVRGCIDVAVTVSRQSRRPLLFSVTLLLPCLFFLLLLLSATNLPAVAFYCFGFNSTNTTTTAKIKCYYGVFHGTCPPEADNPQIEETLDLRLEDQPCLRNRSELLQIPSARAKSQHLSRRQNTTLKSPVDTYSREQAPPIRMNN